MTYVVEEFDRTDADRLAPYVTNLDKPVFALRNLPEVTKGALFARYSRSSKSLRRLLLDEFIDAEVVGGPVDATAGSQRATGLYSRVLSDYGDDSVAQLGFAHVACEQVSNILTKIIERGRLAAYLEQSTRYIPFDSKPGGRWRYAIEPDVAVSALAATYTETLDSIFESYSSMLPKITTHLEHRFPIDANDDPGVYKRTIRAKAYDALRGLLPAATTSNVGMAGSGQAFESLLLRLAAHPLAEAREYGEMMLVELDAVIPSFVRRMHVPERGGVWVEYLARTRSATEALAERVIGLDEPDDTFAGQTNPIFDNNGVTLVDFDPDGEDKVVAACLYGASSRSQAEIRDVVAKMSAQDRLVVLNAAVGERTNRRHKPGRGFERTDYRFDIVTDYGAFRDLQRHRLLSIEWQALSPTLGYAMPADVADAGLDAEFVETIERSAAGYSELCAGGFGRQAQYMLCLAHNIRFTMQANAREMIHLIELRSSAQGHPAYRRVAHAMHRSVELVHPAIAATMSFVDYSEVDLERLEAERRNAQRSRGAQH